MVKLDECSQHYNRSKYVTILPVLFHAEMVKMMYNRCLQGDKPLDKHHHNT